MPLHTITVKTSYFHFRQNNSGGTFTEPAQHGLIEARSLDEANEIAEKHFPIYFDGVGDCPCCGDRWDRADGDGTEAPTLYGGSITDAMSSPIHYPWTRIFAVIRRYDGRVEEIADPKWRDGK